MNRELIFSTLFNLIASTSPFVTTGRQVIPWSNVPPSEQPALFMGQGDQNAAVKTGFPTKWGMQAHFYLYCNRSDDPAELAATQLNNCLDAIEQALKPSPVTGYNTLGGLVFNCVIDGRIETDEGLLGPQSVAVVPVTITIVE
jgi:hypothetical protein